MTIHDGEHKVLIVSNLAEFAAGTVNVGRGAALELYAVPEGSVETSTLRLTVNMSADSKVNIFVGVIGSENACYHFTVNLNEPGANLQINGMALLAGNDVCTISTNVFHNSPRCTSNQLVKFLVDDKGHGTFNGLIKFAYDAFGTEAFQNNRNLLSGMRARMESQPQLEIYCDDVKCSHGAATGQLDEQALFYMRSRGIPVDEAKSMLMNAFVSDIIDKIENEEIRERIRRLTEKRLLSNV